MNINQTKNKIKTRDERQKIKRKAIKNTLKQKFLGLIFDCSPQSNLSQFNKIVISKLKLKGLETEKVTIK